LNLSKCKNSSFFKIQEIDANLKTIFFIFLFEKTIICSFINKTPNPEIASKPYLDRFIRKNKKKLNEH
jgi:hypothetical protein